MNLEPKLTLPLLNKFLELIISYHDYKEISDEGLLELIKLIDKEEQFYHIEGNKLYKKQAWLKDQDRIARAKREAEEINNIKDARLKVIKELQYKLAEEFGVDRDNEQVIRIAVSILKKGKEKIASILGVDINNVPDLPVNYYILDYPTTNSKIEIKL